MLEEEMFFLEVTASFTAHEDHLNEFWPAQAQNTESAQL